MDMKQPNLMTVREVAKTGLLSEHAPRIMPENMKPSSFSL